MSLWVFLIVSGLASISAQVKPDIFIIGPCHFYLAGDCRYTGVKYFLYTQSGEEQIWFGVNNETNLHETSYNPDYESKVLIHGYSSNRFLEVLNYIKREYLRRGNVNIFMIDWEYLAQSPCYPAAVWNCRIAGKCASKLIEAIHQVSNEQIHIIGFSLGAHVSGYISNYLSGIAIDRITGLDPALPGFATVSSEKKLDSSDAKFVDIIHTNAFMQGNNQRLGHIDFYVNGGILQPGCFNDENIISCSHHRAPTYFAESINTVVGFWGSYCNSYFDYLLSRCSTSDVQELMGEYVNQEKQGIYMVFTNPFPPYAKGSYLKSIAYRRKSIPKFNKEI